MDLGNQLKFPQHVAETTLRPDIALVCGKNTWRKPVSGRGGRMTACLPVEVGCRGFAGQRMHSASQVREGGGPPSIKMEGGGPLRGGVCYQVLLGHKFRLDQPQLFERPKTRSELR